MVKGNRLAQAPNPIILSRPIRVEGYPEATGE
jgi:hypothetical protein